MLHVSGVVSGAEIWISGMEIGALEVVGKSKKATFWARRGAVATPLLGHGRVWAPQPSPMTLCAPILSLPERTMTKVCLLEALV